MKKIKNLLGFCVFLLLFTNCQNKDYDNFFENEKLRLIDFSNELFQKLELENYEIIAYVHKNLNNQIISKSLSNTKWSGSNFQPEGSFSDNDIPPVFADMSNIFGLMEERKFLANYDSNFKKEITYDYISLIIIFDNISNSKKQELLNIFKSNILNIERGDNILIISKDEFNKY